MDIRKEINDFSIDRDKEILFWLLKRYHWTSQWNFVAKAGFHQFGKKSYQVNRVWAPTIEGKALHAYMTTERCINCQD